MQSILLRCFEVLKVSKSGINRTLTQTLLTSHHLSVLFLLVNINNSEKMLALKFIHGKLIQIFI